MITLGVCMIVRDEEAVLARCLDCVKSFADEIVIVDTGSRDATKKIAARYSDLIFDFAWCDDFGKARNFSFSKSTADYIMWLDADDFIDTENQQKMLRLKQRLSLPDSPDCVMAKYVVSEAPSEFYYYRERILRRVVGYVWQEPVHEVITPAGKIEYCDVEILHKKVHPTPAKRNLNIYRKIIKSGKALSPRAQYYYARELYYNGYYKKAITTFDQFLASSGWVENKIDACVLKSDCYIRLNKLKLAQSALIQSFLFAAPRAKVACLLAEILMQQKSYTYAVEWLNLATTLPRVDFGWIEPDFHNYRPYLDLSICYYFLNNRGKAKEYHDLAKSIHPSSPEILYNSQFFDK